MLIVLGTFVLLAVVSDGQDSPQTPRTPRGSGSGNRFDVTLPQPGLDSISSQQAGQFARVVEICVRNELEPIEPSESSETHDGDDDVSVTLNSISWFLIDAETEKPLPGTSSCWYGPGKQRCMNAASIFWRFPPTIVTPVVNTTSTTGMVAPSGEVILTMEVLRR